MSKNTEVFEHLVETERQRGFTRDFLATWEDCEFWDTVEVGQMKRNARTFIVEEEDVVAYNRALGGLTRSSSIPIMPALMLLTERLSCIRYS